MTPIDILRGALRSAAAIFVVAAAVGSVGCIHRERPPTGRPPEGEVRVPVDPETRARREAEARAASDEAGASQPGTTGVVVPGMTVFGDAASKIYHRPGCAALQGVATGEQIVFVTPWDALNGGQSPCAACRPGP